MAILRLPAVKAEMGHRSHASIYNAIRAGLFTNPVPIGQRAVGWPDDEVQAINAARIAGASDEQIRELVKQLHSKRAEKLAALMAA
jgi:prophage regulatory protein